MVHSTGVGKKKDPHKFPNRSSSKSIHHSDTQSETHLPTLPVHMKRLIAVKKRKLFQGRVLYVTA